MVAAWLNPNRPVVVICMSGHRSPLAAWRLKKNGAAEVYHLVGGLLAYKLIGGATRSGKAAPD
ncbi:MAG: hypothetical protein JJV98_21335 [Desulfosarcina sp.]|nr:hypothetical protein [Desulfobacterales bacterium]